MTLDERLFRIHAVCRYLRYRPDEPCKRCPLTFIDPRRPEDGECQKGCVGLAEEVINIAVHGHPHGERGIELHGQKWRERFNVE